MIILRITANPEGTVQMVPHNLGFTTISYGFRLELEKSPALALTFTPTLLQSQQGQLQMSDATDDHLQLLTSK